MEIELPPVPEPAAEHGFEWPYEYKALLECGLTDLGYWHIRSPDDIQPVDSRCRVIEGAGHDEVFLGFAQCDASDDAAFWVVAHPRLQRGDILLGDLGHPSLGWTDGPTFPVFWDWLRAAVDDLIDHLEHARPAPPGRWVSDP